MSANNSIAPETPNLNCLDPDSLTSKHDALTPGNLSTIQRVPEPLAPNQSHSHRSNASERPGLDPASLAAKQPGLDPARLSANLLAPETLGPTGNPIPGRVGKLHGTYLSAEDAVARVKSSDRVFLHGSAATPVSLVKALQDRHSELKGVELVSITTLGKVDFDDPRYRESFFYNSLFVSACTCNVVNSLDGDYVPVFLSQIPQLFKQHILPIDVALIQVSPPDEHGYCSLGTSVDIARAAVDVAKHVIAQVNPRMPRTHGDGFIHVRDIDALVYQEAELPETDYSGKSGLIVEKIGEHIASMIEDGATLQMGIGGIPDQVLKNLTGHKDLGLHTEMMSDGVIPLIQSGVINNKYKKVNPGYSVTSFINGTRRLFDFVDDNPEIRVMDIAYVNDTSVIRQNPKATAINSAIEIDLTGQVCADSIGTYQYSGIGGQMDFMRGASLSEGGLPIIALPSVTSRGASRIVPFLKEGAGVVTTRGHVHWVVTEYGKVDLFGKNLKQRARALIEIAHPDHRQSLENAFFNRFK